MTATSDRRGLEKVKKFSETHRAREKNAAEAMSTFNRWQAINRGENLPGLNNMIAHNMAEHGLEWPPRVDVHADKGIRDETRVWDYQCNLCGDKFTGMWTSHQCKVPPDGRYPLLVGTSTNVGKSPEQVEASYRTYIATMNLADDAALEHGYRDDDDRQEKQAFWRTVEHFAHLAFWAAALFVAGLSVYTLVFG